MEQIDKEIDDAMKIAKNEGDSIVSKSYSLSWWDRNFTSKEDEIREELRYHWQNFGMWQDRKLRERDILFHKKLSELTIKSKDEGEISKE